MLSPIKLQGFYHHYLWKETMNVLDFFQRDSNQEKKAYNTTAGWVWPCMPPSHAQRCLDLPGLNLVGLKVKFGHITRSSECKINWILREKSVIFHVLHEPLND